MEVPIKGQTYTLDGLLPLKWGDLKAARKQGLLKPGGDQDATNDEMLLYILRRVCPDAGIEDVDALTMGVGTRVLAEALGVGQPVPFPNSSTPATTSGGPSDGVPESSNS